MTPAPRLLYGAAAWTLAGLACTWWPALLAPWWGLGLALLLAAGADAWRARRPPALRLERRAAGVWPVGLWNEVALTLHNEGARALRLEVHDDHPADWEMRGLARRVLLAPGNSAELTYALRPPRRGDAVFGAPHLRIDSPWGLWRGLRRLGPGQAVKVYPDFSSLMGRTLNATERQAPAAGAIRKRLRGEGSDFHQLREYRRGDSLRAIDWKATARHQKPISREYQQERDQQVVFLLDSGRRMLASDDAGSHFDHALNAVLSLGFIAQKQGDAIGLMSFGGDSRWLPPHKGRVGLERLLGGVYDVQPTETAPDYLQAAGALLGKLNKRAFVVVITNLRDEDDQAMRRACELLSSKHLVLCASLREHALDAAVAAPVDSFADALRQAATALYLGQRRDAIARLGMRAEHLIDVTPERLAVALLQRYRAIKVSGRL